MRNNLAKETLTVVPVARSVDGKEANLSPVTLQPNEVKSLDLHDLLNSGAPQLIGRYGSLVFRYNSPSMRNLYAVAMVHDAGYPVEFHLDSQAQETWKKGSREGIWWLPNATATNYLILTNVSERPIMATLSLYAGSGQAVSQKIQFAPRSTERLSVRDLVSRAGIHGSFGGIQISTNDGAGSLDSTSILFDEAAGFGAMLKMFDHTPETKREERDFAKTGKWTTRAPMLALETPDPFLAFPEGTVLEPQLFLRNTIANPIKAHLSLNWRSASTKGTVSLPDLILARYETRRVDVKALQDDGTIPKEANWASIVLVTDCAPDDLMAVAASYDKSLRYGAQTPFSDQLSIHMEGGQWQVDATHNSLIAAGNGSPQPIKAALNIFYNQGQDQYSLERTLQPEEQMWIDMGQLIRNQLADKSGKVLPSDLTAGSYQLKEIEPKTLGSLYEGKVIIDKTFGHAAYGCMTCCGPGGGQFGPDPWSGAIGFSGPGNLGSYDGCSGAPVDVTQYYTQWWTGDSTITTASYAQFTGVGTGTTHGNALGHIPYGDGQHARSCPVLTNGAVQQTTAFTPIQHNYPRNPLPVACRIAQFFDRIGHAGTSHRAEDVVFDGGGTTWGTPVYAMEAGTVVKVVSNAGPASVGFPQCQGLGYPGNRVNIQGSDGYITVYYHVMPLAGISVGTQVSQGQQIGSLDNSGCQSGPHLHVGRIGSNGPVNFTIPCTNPLPANGFGDGSVDDDDIDVP